MNVILLLQARMGSTRLPGKVLCDLAGRPMLEAQIRRLRQCQSIDRVVVATSDAAGDQPIVACCDRVRIDVFRGSEQDVLSRFVGAAVKYKADVVVRCTGDCPLIDAGIVDQVVGELVARRTICDYASNVLNRTFPRGLDVEAMYMDTLLRIDRMATHAGQREHVTILLRQRRDGAFLCYSVEDKEDRSHLRWTVDTAEDLAWVSEFYRASGAVDGFPSYRQMLAVLDQRPDLVRLDKKGETWDPAH